MKGRGEGGHGMGVPQPYPMGAVFCRVPVPCVCVLGALASAWEFNPWQHAEDTLAERLRRRPAKPMGFPRVGSNPTGVDLVVMDKREAPTAAHTPNHIPRGQS